MKPVVIAALMVASVLGCSKPTRTATADSAKAPAHSRSALSMFSREVHVPEGTRIRVEVLNATSTRGLGRKAMMFLRDRGFDVVALGTADSLRDSTLVLDRSNHPDWAKLAADAMEARSEARPDTSRYLDLTVLVGASWRPPAEPLYP